MVRPVEDFDEKHLPNNITIEEDNLELVTPQEV